MKTEILTVCDRLVAGAANGVFQGILVALVVALILRSFRRSNAATRHGVWFCTLLLLVSLVIAHCVLDPAPSVQQGSEIESSLASANVGIPISIFEAGEGSGDTSVKEGNGASSSPSPDGLLSHGGEPVAPESRGNPMGHVAPGTGIDELLRDREEHAQNSGRSSMGWIASWISRLAKPDVLKLAVGSNLPTGVSAILVFAFLGLMGLRFAVLISRIAQLRRLKRDSFPPGEALSRVFEDLKEERAIGRQVELRLSPTGSASFLLGYRHPVILLPAEADLQLAEAEQVLRHELAHVQRRDDWTNLIQHFVMAAFPFHPAIWWISSQLSLEREIACDDHVLNQAGHPRSYALLLTELAARMQKQPLLLAPGATNAKTQLQQRITMILNPHRNTSPRLAKPWLACLTSAAVLLAVAIIYSAPRIVLAQSAAIPAPVTVTSSDSVVTSPDGTATLTITRAVSASSADSEATAAEPVSATVSSGPKYIPDGEVLRGQPPAPGRAPRISTGLVGPVRPAVANPAAAGAPPQLYRGYAQAQPGTSSSADGNYAPGAPRSMPPSRVRREDSSLEQRLERVERMLDSLMARQNQGPGRLELSLNGQRDFAFSRDDNAKMELQAKRQAEMEIHRSMEAKEAVKAKEKAGQDLYHAGELGKRAAEQAERAASADLKRQPAASNMEDTRKQIEALRKQAESLEREKSKLDRQIEQLERNQELLEKHNESYRRKEEPRSDEPQGKRPVPVTRQAF